VSTAAEADWLTSDQVVRQAGITYRRLDYWTRVGYLSPAVPAAGNGSARVWTPWEAEIAGRIRRLSEAGLPVEAAVRYARRDWPDGEIGPGLRLVVTG
jgi:DNA-binding transcriptional MerR regulator